MKTVMQFLTWAGILRQPLSLGQRGEKAAARYLRRQGYRVLARNIRSKLGELDLVVLDGQTIVFVEVKTRANHEAGLPVEAIDSDKQRRLTRLALHYLQRHRLLEQSARFDRRNDHWRVRDSSREGLYFSTRRIPSTLSTPRRGTCRRDDKGFFRAGYFWDRFQS